MNRDFDSMTEKDPGRFENLFQANESRARIYVRRKLGLVLRRRVNSEDVLQDVLLDATRAFRVGTAPEDLRAENFFSWLAKMIDNRIRYLARFHVEAQRRTVRKELPFDADGCVVGGPVDRRTPSWIYQEVENSSALREAIHRLSPRKRELIQLIYFDRLSVSQAAKELGKTPGATAVLHFQALRRLAQILQRKER